MTGIGGHHSPVGQTNIWLTPPSILQCLGSFDLDPCAAPDPRPWPTAKQHYCPPEDGLSLPWNDRVFLNPPYGGPAIVGPWMMKMSVHNHGTALIFARTETELFFKTVWNVASAVMFLKGRLFFHYPDGSKAKGNSGAPSILIAYGKEDAHILESCGVAGQFLLLR